MKQFLKYAATAVVAMIVGAALVNSNPSTAATTPKTIVKTHTVTVAKTPLSCKVAVIGLNAVIKRESHGAEMGFQGVQDMNIPEINQGTEIVKSANRMLRQIEPKALSCIG